jgi:hypothetical protein
MSALSSLPELFGLGSGSTPAPQDRGYELAWEQVRHTRENMLLGAAADPTVSQWLHQLDFNNRPQIYWGRVVDGVAWASNLKVQLENTATPISCVMATHTPLRPIGVRQLHSIGIDSAVYVLWHPTAEVGVILGVEPEFSISGRTPMADFISQAGRSGLSVDLCHKSPFNTVRNGLISDRSAGRPFDATLNEFGYITETGMALTLDSFMGQLRADEETGLWVSYWDQVCRLAGHNLQLWSSGTERSDEDDESEFSAELGYSPYIWETLGSLAPMSTVSRNIDADLFQQDPDFQQYSGLEPLDDHQQAWFRLRDFFGYYGQAHKRVLNVQPVSGFPGDVLTTPDTPVFPGVYEENLSLTGRKSFRTAHEFIIAKRLYVPTPKRKVLAADPNGDNDSNYLFAGMPGFGDGPAHQITGEIATTGGDAGWVHATGFLDTQAFVFNWEALHPFHYHGEDQDMPQESELPFSCTAPNFPSLATAQYLPVPSPVEVYVDHRYGPVKMYPNHSSWALTADGGSIFTDGYGSQIRMTEGCIDITAPGDVRILAGRSFVAMAGKDTIIRAHGSVDVSASCHDVRIKAKHNLHMVTTDTCSSILMDCRATGDYCDIQQGEDATFGGIMLKAKNSTIAEYAQRIHLTTEGVVDGTIILSAENGRIRQIGEFIENFAEQAIMDIFYDGASVNSVNEWWTDSATICSPLRVNGALAVAACGWFGSNLFVQNGHIATSQAAANKYLVQPLQGAPATTANTVISDIATICSHSTSAGSQELATTQDYTICKDMEFSFRTVTQMQTSDWTLWETHWQQMARLNGQSLMTWTEDPVLFMGSPTYPYPGKERWVDSPTWYHLNLNMYDATTLRAQDRPGPYTTPVFAAPVNVNPDGAFTIITT